eukprot:1796107-Pyramimonas_sp.AAC.1
MKSALAKRKHHADLEQQKAESLSPAETAHEANAATTIDTGDADGVGSYWTAPPGARTST